MSSHKHSALLFALLVLLLVAPAWADGPTGPSASGILTSPPPIGGFVGGLVQGVPRDKTMTVTALERDAGFSTFIAQAGPGWAMQWNPLTGTPHLASGKAMAIAGAGRLSKDNIEPACLGFVRDNAQLLKVDPAQLKLASAVRAGSCWYVAFQQVYGGVPVYGGQLTMSFTRDDRLIMFGSDVFPGLTAQTTPRIDGKTAVATALADCGALALDSQASGAELSILPVTRAAGLDPILCWKFTVLQQSVPKKWQYFVDAVTGEIAAKWDALVYDNITGTVSGEYKPEFAADATQIGPFKYAKVSESSGASAVFAQADGTYSIAAPYDPSRIASAAEGMYCDVSEMDGTDPLFERTGAHPGGVVDWTWDAGLYGASQHIHVPSVYHHVNYAHDYYKALDPSFTALDYPMPARVGIPGYSNAYWDGNGVAFGAGDSNYADFGLFSDVIYHEYTHGVTDKCYIGSVLPYTWESGALNEGWSDYFGCVLSISQLPRIGDGGLVRSQSLGFRVLDNYARRETDWANEVHTDSLVFSGSLWGARTALGSAIMDPLVHFARYRHGTDYEGALTALLAEDDARYGDGDLTNGTPHGQTIYTSFGDHGIGGLQYQLQSLIVDDSSGNADGKLDPGETDNLSLTLSNGWANATNVHATLATTDIFVTITKATATFPDAARGATISNAGDKFTLSVSPTCPDTHTISFTLTVTADGPYSYARTCYIFVPVAVRQLAYDDGGRDTGNPLGRWGIGSAVRMTPDVYPCHLTQLRLWPLTSCKLTVSVWDDDGSNGSPGSVLGTKNVDLSYTNNWTDIDISSLNISVASGSVYVGWVENGTAYSNGLDYDPPHSARSWIYDGYYWRQLEAYGLLANMLIRARYSSAPPLQINDPHDFSWRKAQPVSGCLIVSDGTNPLSWGLVSGALPPGVGLNTATGGFVGSPTTAGTYTATIEVTDSSNPVREGQSQFTFGVCAGAPPAPSISNPALGATGVLLDTTLNWQCTGALGATTYDVYFGLSCQSMSLICPNTTSLTCEPPGDLQENTTYYWRVVSKNACGSTQGQCWSFTTGTRPPIVSSPYEYTWPEKQSVSGCISASGGVPPYSNWTALPFGGDDYTYSVLGSSAFSYVGVAKGWKADDASWSYTLPFAFPFYGTNRTGVNICSNGFLDFTNTTTDYNNTTAKLMSSVRIAPMWDDLNTSGGDVYIDGSITGQVTFRWHGIAYTGGYPVDFAAVLFSDGRIRFDYGSGNVVPAPTVGISSGDGAKYVVVPGYDGASNLTSARSVLFTPTSGSPLPPGISLNSTTGCFTGTPTTPGDYLALVQVSDSQSPARIGQQAFAFHVLDMTPPTVSSITSTHADGTCKIGDLVNVQIALSEPVYVTRSPRLQLETGAIDRNATYSAGSGSSTLTFVYTVQSGDNSSDLDYTSIAALSLNGGALKDAAGNDATLALPAPASPGSLGYNKSIVVDGVRPAVVDVTSAKPNGSYKAGDVIDIAVTFNEPVDVTGVPLLELETGAVDEKPGYVSGAGTNVVIFRYIVQPGDTSADLSYKATNSLTGTIRDLPGNSATLTLPGLGATGSLSKNKNLVIDTSAPTSGAAPAGGLYAGSKSVVLSASESATIRYTTDGSEPSQGSSAYSAPINVASDTTLRFYALDAAGNEESPKHQEVYTIITDNGSIASAKQLLSGETVRLGNKALYLKWPGFAYIEEPDRFAGIRVAGAVTASQGDRVCLIGTIQKPQGGAPYIQVAAMAASGSGAVKPLGASNRTVGLSLMNGIYATAWGRVKPGSITGNSYVITDGSDDVGVRVMTRVTPTVTPGDFVMIAGALDICNGRVLYEFVSE